MDTTGAGARLVAFRCWRIKDGRLTAMYRDRAWPLGERAQAECLCAENRGYMMPMDPLDKSHEPPSLDKHGCGFYSYDRLETLIRYIENESGFMPVLPRPGVVIPRSGSTTPLLAGVIRVWGVIRVGRVVTHEAGSLTDAGYRLRSQFAQILALERCSELEDLEGAERVAHVDRRYLEAWAAELGGERYRLEPEVTP